MGVKAVFGPGTPTHEIADFIKQAVEEREGQAST
jgi:methylmalonyl-CoA mutase cobalamin-binding subunit